MCLGVRGHSRQSPYRWSHYVLQETVSSVFSSLHPSLQQVLSQRLAWTELREVQEQAYSAVTAGKDTLIIAPTAGGKSEAALIPVMDAILRNGWPGVTCLYLSPLKALINDQEERFSAFCIPTTLSVMKWHGDVAKGDRTWNEEPPHFLMITPESLEVLLQERDLADSLRQVRYIIVDELHAFVESDRGIQLRILLHRMDQLTGRKIQRIGLSATAGNPKEILTWLSNQRQGTSLVAVPSAPKEKHFRFIVEPEERKRTDALVRIVEGRKALVFVGSRSTAEHLMQALEGRLANLHIHHSSLAPATRRCAEEAIAGEGSACIICTSTLELGIDIGDLDVVVQVSPPSTVSSFLQRMGRTGRRGHAANVAWLLKDSCELLCSAAIIECAMTKEVEDLIPLGEPFNVLIQQIFLYLLTRPQPTRRQIIAAMLALPPFSSLDTALIGRVINHLVTEGYLVTDGEILMPGPLAERHYGRSNWKDLYSVIRGGGELRAVTPEGEVVGMLDARFVSSRAEGEVTLGGRSWTLVKCDEGHEMVVVVPGDTAPHRTFWTGSGEDGYSALVCGKIREIRARGHSLLPLPPPEEELLANLLKTIPNDASAGGMAVMTRKGTRSTEVLVYTFSGARFNRLLAILLGKRLGGRARVRYTDFHLVASRLGKDGGPARVCSALKEIRGMTSLEAMAAVPLPPAAEWKFGRTLPPDLFARMVLADRFRFSEFAKRIHGMDVFLCRCGDEQEHG